jgi:hypothetical protein
MQNVSADPPKGKRAEAEAPSTCSIGTGTSGSEKNPLITVLPVVPAGRTLFHAFGFAVVSFCRAMLFCKNRLCSLRAYLEAQ